MPALLELFLGTQLTGVSTLLLAAIGRTRRKSCVAFSANRLVAIVTLGEKRQRGIVDAPTQAQDQMQGRLLLDIVVAQRTSILELFAGKNEALLIRRNPLLVLDLGLDIVNRVRRLHIEGDGLARQGLYENLHLSRVNRINQAE
jgi:hypothetical protein